MAKLEVAVEDHFANGKTVEGITPNSSSRGAFGVQHETKSAIEPAFARINAVTPASPADAAGMKAGDKVTKFGTVDYTNHERLSKVAQVVQQNENVRYHAGSLQKSQY